LRTEETSEQENMDVEQLRDPVRDSPMFNAIYFNLSPAPDE